MPLDVAPSTREIRLHRVTIPCLTVVEHLFYSIRSDGRLCRAPLPHELLLPRRRVGARRAGRAGRRARADRARRDRPPGPVRRRPGRRRPTRRSGCGRSSGSRSSCATRRSAIRTGSSSRRVDRSGAEGRRRSTRRRARTRSAAREGEPDRPRPARARLPGHREAVKEDVRGIGERQRGPHLVLLARDATGYRSLCRLVSRANLTGTKAMPRFDQALLAEHVEGLVALSGCREGEIARRLRAGDRAGARAAARGPRRALRPRRVPSRAVASPAARTTAGS